MSIHFRVLGEAGRDNAAFVQVNSGQSVARLLFDCGDECLDELPLAEVLATDALLFSHLHMDHVGGFDSFFRTTYNRTSKPNVIWGPPETAQIMHHRFRGFMWNLYAGQSATWFVHDIHPEQYTCTRFEAGEAFAQPHACAPAAATGTIIDAPTFTIEAYQMDHATPSMAYIVREKPRSNIDSARLAALGLPSGPWLHAVKVRRPDEAATIEIDGTPHDLAQLREALLVARPGEALAYLTDFLLDDAALARLVPALRGCTTMICESQYSHADLALAQRNYHMTATQAADLARRAGVGRLVLFHVSDRYQPAGWRDLLAEARTIFPNTHFPAHWRREDDLDLEQ